MALTIENLEIQIDANAANASAGIESLQASLTQLQTLVGASGGIVSGLNSIATALGRISRVGTINLNFQGLQNTNLDTFAGQVQRLAAALEPLNGFNAGNFANTVAQLRRIPEITQSLTPETLDQFTAAMQRLVTAMAPLATQMNSISRGFSQLPSRMRSTVAASNQVVNSNNRMRSSYGSLYTSMAYTISRFMILYYAAQRVANVFADWYDESNQYIESLNLFTVSMGDATDAALEYANTVGDLMGIDPAEWFQNQGVFMRMATGFGVASDKAEIMSQNLTQLGYDMASFFNVDVDTAMDKIKSGMTGQIKGLKEYGYNLSVAALQETAYSLGLEQKVTTMTEAQKAQLRYITLIQRSNGIMGDMARTITTPANALRVLNAQITQMKRALGNVTSVIVTRFIPYIQAFVEIIADAANALAQLWGFELPSIDYSGLELGSDLSDELDDATGSAKELKRQLIGIDELNILNDTSTSGSGSSGADYDLGVDLPSYNFLENLKIDTTDFKAKMKEIVDLVSDIGTALAAWGISKVLLTGLAEAVNYFRTGRKELDGWGVAQRAISGIILIGLGVKFGYDAMYNIASGKGAVLDYIKAILAPIAAGLGGVLTFTALGLSGGVGFVIGFTIVALAELVGAIQAKKDIREEAAYQEAVQSIKDNAVMTVEDAAVLFGQWYDSWESENQVVIDLIAAKEGTAEELANIHKGLQDTFSVILSDGVLAEAELAELKTALEGYYTALTADNSANNAIIHEALVGALSRASADGVAYYQELIDKHNEWIELEQGATGQLMSQVTDAAEKLAAATPDTQAYTDAQNELNTALENLSAFTNSENLAKLQTYGEKIADLKEAISSGTLDMTEVEDAKAALEELAGKYNTLLADIETTQEGVMIAVQTEINKAVALGEQDFVGVLGDIKTGLETDFETQKADVIEAANGIGATIAEAIGTQMFNLMQTTDSGTVQRLVDEQYTPLLESWIAAAEDVTTNSEQLKAFPQLLLNTMMSDLENMQPEVDAGGYSVETDESWAQKWINSLTSSLDNTLAETGLGDQAQAYMDSFTNGLTAAAVKKEDVKTSYDKVMETMDLVVSESSVASQAQAMMDGITSGFKSATVLQSDIQSGVDSIVAATETAAGIHSPADIMIPVGENMIAGIEEGMVGYEYLDATYTGIVGDIVSEFNDALETSNSNIKALGSNFVSSINSGIEESIPSLETSFTSMLNSLLTKFETSTNRARNALNTTLRNFSNSMSSVNVSSAGMVTYTAVPYVSIPKFASGGFPSMGEMFIAREAGPELVGRIGNKTSVANNDQIVSGIASGVETANEGVITAIYSMCRQVVTAIEQNGGDVYMDAMKVGEKTTNAQNRSTRMYGKSVQYT